MLLPPGVVPEVEQHSGDERVGLRAGAACGGEIPQQTIEARPVGLLAAGEVGAFVHPQPQQGIQEPGLGAGMAAQNDDRLADEASATGIPPRQRLDPDQEPVGPAVVVDEVRDDICGGCHGRGFASRVFAAAAAGPRLHHDASRAPPSHAHLTSGVTAPPTQSTSPDRAARAPAVPAATGS
ncbi:hypothetical protein GCM10023205_64250 [Yinghuangia aomiensis]|uniref:Uncharacterized protein n=1 Tax=Yinghuangia aomiensis TaxID=676205 RepID=A0ABP9I1I6_9ACTN